MNLYPTHTDENPVEIIHENGRGPVVLLCEHASATIPERYNGLGLRAEDRLSHAAWDPGALAVSRHLSRALDAPLIASCVSRLVYDCNRPPEADSAMPARSETIDVPGNLHLAPTDRAERVDTVYRPFCAAVDRVLAGRPDAVVVTMHSFTPIYHGQVREVEIGILHDDDTRLADRMLATAGALSGRVIRRNEPYGPGDGVTHSLKQHAQTRGLANVMIEIRNDLLTTADQERQMADEILALLRPALIQIGAPHA